jgi:hypothetical protein
MIGETQPHVTTLINANSQRLSIKRLKSPWWIRTDYLYALRRISKSPMFEPAIRFKVTAEKNRFRILAITHERNLSQQSRQQKNGGYRVHDSPGLSRRSAN